MFESLRIRNYRVFRDIQIADLKRINLIAGKNNSGKTSLLEAIFLLSGAGNPQLAMNTNVIREPDLSGGPETVETVWKHLFHALDMNRLIQIEGQHTSHQSVTLKIATELAQTTHLPLDSTVGASLTDIPDGRSLAFRYARSDSPETESHIRISSRGLEVIQPVSGVPFNARIILARSVNISEDATLLGKLRTQKRGDLVLQALRVIEPRLRSVEDSIASGTPMIWGDIGLSEMVPLHVMGEGMTRVARIVLGISSSPGGVVLIDEVENGIHHSVMSDVWRTIGAAAKQFDTQIFATTHSFDCIQAAHESLDYDEFHVHRLRTSDPENNRAIGYDAEEIDVAIRHGLEVR